MAKSGEAASPVISQIVDTARAVETKINGLKKPEMKFPLRNLSNVRYSAKKGHFEMLGKKKERTLAVSTVKSFAQTMRMIALSKQMIETDERASKRDAYYQTKAWAEARCDEQPESDAILDDIEGLFGVNKEQLCFTPDEHGNRPVYGGTEKFQRDPHWQDLLLFHEYFHGDNGAGLGASHQTGWTGVVARILQLFAAGTPGATGRGQPSGS